jgi:glucose/arabinose dehydrogenase
MVFTPDGRMFFTEQYDGTIRILLADGRLQTQPFAEIPVANHLNQDWGLTGLALDPDYENNSYVYAFYTAVVEAGVTGQPTLVRFTDVDGTGTDMTVISDDFPLTADNHQGYNANGEIHFGPDGYLYLSLGDYDVFDDSPETLTDLSTPIGKMLRISAEDGSAAPDNPFADQDGVDDRIYATGFREPFSFAFAPDGTLYGNDNTPVSCEELNAIDPGEDYGWPSNFTFPFDNCGVGDGTQPVHLFAREGLSPENFIAFTEVSGIDFLENSTYQFLTDSMIACESYKSVHEGVELPGVLRRVTLTDASTVATSEVITRDCKGDVTVHEGVVYYSNAGQILRLAQSATNAGGTPPPLEQPGGDDGGDAPTQIAPPTLGG